MSITVFRPYIFSVGEKIHIESGPRHGDWLVMDVSDKKVTLQCPVSKKEFEWGNFCYFIEKDPDRKWPEE